jgi:hypothetical protein
VGRQGNRLRVIESGSVWLFIEVVPSLFLEDVLELESDFLRSGRGYVLDVDGLLAFGHEFLCDFCEHVDVALGVGAEELDDGAVVLLLEEVVEVFVDDLQAVGVLVGDFLLN